MLDLVKQRYSDDCCVAACAMGTDISYSLVLAKAKENGYEPDSDVGIPIDDMLSWLGFTCQISPGFYCPDPKRITLLCIQVRNSEDYHAVMLHRSRIYDPVGLLLGVNLKYCVSNTIYSYWDITQK